MSFSVDQMIFVTDNIDGKKHPCKIVKVNDEKKEIMVHFINWKKSYDEWLSMDSSRIHEDEECLSDADESFQDSQETCSIGAAIGKLLRSVDPESKKVVSTYDIRLSVEENMKNFNKFPVVALERCASNIKIKTKTDSGKKMFNKVVLIRKILLKIKAHLPHQCI